MPNFLAPPTPSHGRPPPHPKISGPKSLDLGSFFFPEFYCLSICSSYSQTAWTEAMFMLLNLSHLTLVSALVGFETQAPSRAIRIASPNRSKSRNGCDLKSRPQLAMPNSHLCHGKWITKLKQWFIAEYLSQKKVRIAIFIIGGMQSPNREILGVEQLTQSDLIKRGFRQEIFYRQICPIWSQFLSQASCAWEEKTLLCETPLLASKKAPVLNLRSSLPWPWAWKRAPAY